MIKDMSIEAFLEALAARQSTPGGGSAAAVSAAIGAALISMVANFTVGKKGCDEAGAARILARSERLRLDLTAAIKADVDAFNQVMAAYGMPRESEAEKAARGPAIQAALKVATDAPLECARLSREVIELSRSAAETGNVNVISDAGVAALTGYAGLKSAALNVYINIGNIKDREFAEDRRARLASCLAGMEALKEEVYEWVKGRL